MKRSTITTVALGLLFAGTFSASVYLQNIGVRAIRLNPPFLESWQLTGRSAEGLKLASLQYDLVTADMLWLRAIQSFGGRGMTNRDWKPLYNMFDVITELDPYFAEAYTFGNLVIGDEGGYMKEGLQLLEKGTFNVYRQYRIPFEGMYVAHWQMKDPLKARWFGRIASERPDAPDWANRITAYIDVQSGEYYVGFDRFVGNLLEAIEAKEPALQQIAFLKAKETIEKWNASLMLKALDQYTSRTGQMPERIEQLADMPALQNYEIASMSKLIGAVERRARDLNLEMGIDPEIIGDVALPSQAELDKASDQTSVTQDMKKLSDFQGIIFRESLEKRSGIPEDPFGGEYQLNRTLLADERQAPEDRIARSSKVKDYVQSLLIDMRTYLSRRREELGGRNPKSLEELFETDFQTTEPLGGQWQYDPETGHIRSSSYPDL